MRYKRWNLVKIQRKKRQKFMVMLIIAAFLIVPFTPVPLLLPAMFIRNL